MATVLSSNLLVQAIRSVIPLGSLRDGEVVEARVNGMVGKDVARLTLLGATLDVDTPIQLVPGSTIKVAVERSAEGLRLVLQRDGNAATVQQPSLQKELGTGAFRSLSLAIAQAAIDNAPNAAVPAQSPGVHGEAVPGASGGLSLAIAQGVIDSELDAADADPSTAPDSSADTHSEGEIGRPTADQQRPHRDNSGLGHPVANTAQYHASRVRFPSAPASNTPDAKLSTASAQNGVPVTTPPPAAQPNTTMVAYLPPGAVQPFNLTFVREDEAEKGGSQAEASNPAWTVRFSFESPGLGPLHAAIRLSEGGIGVKIWAERPDVALALEQDSAELRNTLQASAISVEAVAVLPGRPPGQNAGSGAVPPTPPA